MCNTVIITFLLIYTLIFFNIRWCSCNENSPNKSNLRCKPYERAALLNFKHSLTFFDKTVSSSWVGEECCNWSMVVCDNTTGHILELDLNGHAYFNGHVLNYFGLNYLLKMEKVEESLVYLLELRQLETLDLSINDFSNSSIPRVMGSMKQLRYLDLSHNSLGGLIPYELGNLTNLEYLDLSINVLSGEIPSSLGKLSNLKELYLSDNELSAKIPTSVLGKLSKLTIIDISNNPMEGTALSEPDFANLTSLTQLYMEDTMLTLNLSSDWVPPFQLQSFSASNINGQLPLWLQTQKNLNDLFLSDANISGLMPSWFHTMQQLDEVDLSNNNLSGSPIFPINFSRIYLSNSSLSGEFLSNVSKTEVYENANFIDLSDNLLKLSGPLLEGLGHRMPNLKSLFLSNNKISGQIPNSLCQLTSLTALDISNNSLSGEIPNCFANLSRLSLLSLSHNKLTRNIPCFNNSDMDFYLHLNDNMLSGEIPSCLSDLVFLDIGENQLSGKMLKWFSAGKFNELQILRLRGNKFSGTIPSQICSLPVLRVIDLGHNQFMGSIPRCLSNLTAMNSPDTLMDYSNDVSEVIQGIERAYTRTLRYLVDIDLSCNNLVGSIPDDMTNISGLLSLNLSYNQLSGTIPVNIGDLNKLISLDLSKNKLRGSIPTSIGEIYTLSYLNLSYNNLSGQVPTGNQLQVLSDQASIYAGNPYLCGDALPKKCKSKVEEQDNGRSNEGKGGYNKKQLERMGFDLVVMSGFATGFWGIVGCLVLNRRWRHAFFRSVEDGYYWLYDAVALSVRVAKAKMNRK